LQHDPSPHAAGALDGQHSEPDAGSVAAAFVSLTEVAGWPPLEIQWKSSATAILAWHNAVVANSNTASRTNVLMTCPPCLKRMGHLMAGWGK
jgi:hypothetical protein